MIKSLAHKELREIAGIAALGLAAFVVVAAASAGIRPFAQLLGQRAQGQIPFLDDRFLTHCGIVACGLAIALGFRQSLGDFFGDAQGFLLHRPVRRRTVYLTKIAVGLGAYFLLTGAAILAYAGWAALPGTHASPFDWSMTAAAWTSCLAISAVYLGAFLSGIRPAAWLGTRLAPLAATLGLAILAAAAPAWIAWPGSLAFDLLLVLLILWVVATRDFA